MAEDRLERLNALGFVWNAEPPGRPARPDHFTSPKQNELWQANYDRLAAFHKLSAEGANYLVNSAIVVFSPRSPFREGANRESTGP